jgi:hypothetical protein
MKCHLQAPAADGLACKLQIARRKNAMGLEILSLIVGTILFVGGWTYFLNYDPQDEHVSWQLESIPYVLFLILGKNRQLFRIVVCAAGLILMFYGGSGILGAIF